MSLSRTSDFQASFYIYIGTAKSAVVAFRIIQLIVGSIKKASSQNKTSICEIKKNNGKYLYSGWWVYLIIPSWYIWKRFNYI